MLIAPKLDRLSRNPMDVRQTVELGGVDLTNAAGKMTMQVLRAVAEFERDLLRTYPAGFDLRKGRR
jgi:putative DNA-invertase from lambdoid prophage Rac